MKKLVLLLLIPIYSYTQNYNELLMKVGNYNLMKLIIYLLSWGIMMI